VPEGREVFPFLSVRENLMMGAYPRRDRDAVADATAVWEAVEREEAALEGRGRVLVRSSGTEPLVRVMVEAPTDDECEQVCARLVGVVRHELA
jgi:phosphoglucosamine mutase